MYQVQLLEIEQMARKLAIYLTWNTRFIKLNDRVDIWRASKNDITRSCNIPDSYVEFKMKRFFGVALDYNLETDILAYWYLDKSRQDSDYLERGFTFKKTGVEQTLKDLGENFSSRTKWQFCQGHRGSAKLLYQEDYKEEMADQPVNVKRVSVPIIDFFGMDLGYSKELDTLIVGEY
jgi:hypothetical protein